MNDILTDKIAIYLLDENESIDYIKIKYYLESMLGEIEKFLILLVVFGIYGYAKEILLIMIIMLLIRPYVGGTHFSNYWLCLIYTFVVCIATIVLSEVVEYNCYIHMGAFLLMLMVVVVYAPVKSEFRPHYVGNLRKRMKVRAVINLLLIGALQCFFCKNKMLIAMLLIVLSFDAIVAWCKSRRGENDI